MGRGDPGCGSLAGLVGGVAMAWFLQMWLQPVLLNGRLLRENALQGAEQLGAEIVRALEWGALCLQRTGRHLLLGSVSGRLAGQEAKGNHSLEGAISPPRPLPVPVSPPALSHIQESLVVRNTGSGD